MYIVSRTEGIIILINEIKIQTAVKKYFLALIFLSICFALRPSEKIITVKSTGFTKSGKVVII